MRIDGAIPINVARAYGIQSMARPAAVRSLEAATPSAAPTRSEPSGKIQQLIAGKVAGPVDFSTGTSSTTSGAFQLYTRVADRMEAAVGIQLGRSLDVRG